MGSFLTGGFLAVDFFKICRVAGVFVSGFFAVCFFSAVMAFELTALFDVFAGLPGLSSSIKFLLNMVYAGIYLTEVMLCVFEMLR
jgi:hypothetical protein